MVDMNKSTYSINEVAEIFDVEPATIRQWVKREIITPLPDKVKMGRGAHVSIFTHEEVVRLANERYGNVRH